MTILFKLSLLSLLLSPALSIAQDVPSQKPPAQSKPDNPNQPPPATAPAPKNTTPPKVTFQVEPEFPEGARRSRLGGSITVALTVDAEGIPRNVHVVEPLADKVAEKNRKAALTLDQKAAEAVEKYRFKPATRDGKSVSQDIRIAVTFQIF